MNLKNGLYVNGSYINDIIFEEVEKIEDRKYYVNLDKKLIEVSGHAINFTKFIIVPGFRLIPTIEEQSETAIAYNKENLFFEKENKTRYLLNVDRVFTVECVDNVFWKVTTIDNDEYWFKAFNENFKHFISKLVS